jgi:hypothetical protein
LYFEDRENTKLRLMGSCGPKLLVGVFGSVRGSGSGNQLMLPEGTSVEVPEWSDFKSMQAWRDGDHYNHLPAAAFMLQGFRFVTAASLVEVGLLELQLAGPPLQCLLQCFPLGMFTEVRPQ